MLSSVLSLIQDAVTVLGGGVLVWGAIQFGLAIKDRSGSDISQALSILLGGAVIIAAALFFSQLDTGSL